MNWALFTGFNRVFLAVSVSVWMAGGCLFGCSNTHVMAAEFAEASDAQANTVEASGESCHTARAHDCCTKPASQKPAQKQIVRHPTNATDNSALAGFPKGMNDCPLVANARAVTAKNSGNLPDPGRAPVIVSPSLSGRRERMETTIGPAFLPNRGPTHLRNCVFLI